MGKAKVSKPSPKRKVLKQKRKIKEKKTKKNSTSSSSDSEEIERKRRRKKHSGLKRKGKSPSSSSNVSEASANDKRFKVILRGEKFEWNLSYSMAGYANNHFNSYTPEKDIEEKLLTENPSASKCLRMILSDRCYLHSHDIRPSNGKILEKNPGRNGSSIRFLEKVREYP